MNIELPRDFTERMAGQLGDQFPAFLSSYEHEAVRGIRMNPFRHYDPDHTPGILSAIPWEKNGYYLSTDSDAGAVPEHEAGAYYIQEPSAMVPAAVMDAQPGEWILDLCSAPGGKSTQLAVALQGKGLLVSNEPVPKRAQILAGNIERMGIPNALVVSAYPDRLAQQWPECFDGVQVDAPCSGEGMFRKYPETRSEWTRENAEGCALRQKEILAEAAKLVRPGGRLVYSTCTMNPAENEKIVQWFLDEYSDFQPEGFELPGIEGSSGSYMFYPHLDRGEGQFVAKFRKAGQAERGDAGNCSFPKASKEEVAAIKAFDPTFPEVTGRFGKTLFSLPNCPDTGKIKVIRAGIHLGEVKGKLFFPDHAWAMAAVEHDLPVTEVTEEEAIRYLAGETLQRDNKGWQIIRYREMPLGWGKGSDGIIKNHYPKGLRKYLTYKEK